MGAVMLSAICFLVVSIFELAIAIWGAAHGWPRFEVTQHSANALVLWALALLVFRSERR